MNRYADPIDAVWEPTAVYGRWLAVSRAVLFAARTHRLVPPFELDSIPLEVTPVMVEQIARREAEVGHDVVAFLDVLRDRCEPEVRDWVHFGLTSSNLVDTGLVLALQASSDYLTNVGGSLANALENLPSVPRASRTHGQLAEVSTLSNQGYSWAARVRSALMELHDVTANLRANLGGPTGLYQTFTVNAARTAAAELGVNLELSSEQAIRRDSVARWGRAVADLTTAAAHFAYQVRLGVRDGELHEPTGVSDYRGSSSMPWKRNPTRSERIVGLERVTRAFTSALDADVVWWDQRDISASSVERVVLPQLAGLTAYCLTEALSIAQNLEVDAHACHQAIERLEGRDPAALWRAVASGDSHGGAYDALR